jgi:ferritin-like protein
MGSENLHEEGLSDEVRDFHRAVVSLMEELEAIDWYGQRVAACSDEQLRTVLAHNRKEEIEHAAMTLEWIRRNDSEFDLQLRTVLFREAPITEVEEQATGKAGGIDGAGAESGGAASSVGSLGIGSLRKR